MRRVGFLLGIVALALSAGEVVVISGSSTLGSRKLRSTTLGSMQQKDLGTETPAGGLAILKDAAGKVQEVPCEVQFYPLEGGKGETVAWRVGIPVSTVLQSLKVVSGDRVVAEVATPPDVAPPSMEFIDTRNGREASMGWVLKRPERFRASSVWVRWSWDEGRSWASPGKFLYEETGTGQMELKPAPKGASGDTLLEFWVPQGLNLTRFQHRIAGRFEPL